MGKGKGETRVHMYPPLVNLPTGGKRKRPVGASVQLNKIQDARNGGDVSYPIVLEDAFDAYGAIVLYAKTMSSFILRVHRKRPDATRLYKEITEQRGVVWTDAIRDLIQDTLDREHSALWNTPLGYDQAHAWMAALFLFLNSTDIPEVTSALQPYMNVPTNDDERRALVQELIKYMDDQTPLYLDKRLLKEIYEHRVVNFDIVLKRRIASHLDHLLDDAFGMFGVILDAPMVLFRADDRKNSDTIADISTTLQELSETVVSTSIRRDIGELFCGSFGNDSPCVVYKFHIAAGTRVLPITADHPFLKGSLVDPIFMPFEFENEVLLPKGLTYQLQPTAPKNGKTLLGRSEIMYSVLVQ